MSESEFVRRLRIKIAEDPNLTVAGLSKAAGLDNSAIRSLLSGKAKNPRADTMDKICAALGTTVDEFMAPRKSPEEVEIARLVSLLPASLRRQILGYAQAVAANQDPQQQESNEELK